MAFFVFCYLSVGRYAPLGYTRKKTTEIPSDLCGLSVLFFRIWLGFISLTDSHRVIEPVSTLIPKHQQRTGASHYATIAAFHTAVRLSYGAKVRRIIEMTKHLRKKS